MRYWKPLLISIFAVLGCSEGGPASSDQYVDGDSFATLREACLDFTNEKRASEGKTPLVLWSDASKCSDQQAKDDWKFDSPHGHFGDCNEGAQNTCPGWPANADTAAQREVLINCLTMMWNEGPGEPYSAHGHYINMSNSQYTKVTCGFYYENGSLWINQNFR